MKRVVAIFGMPRSGTSFVGQIFDSHPKTAFRLEPIFSYKLKNIVNKNSSRVEFIDFFQRAFESDLDVFMNQEVNRDKGIYPKFKKENADILVIKTTRFHEIIPTLLKHFDSSVLRIVSIVRHPCGAIHSWLSTPKEFPQHLDKNKEWRTGQCRKNAEEEYWGFDDWKKVTSMHVEMETKFNNFKIFLYEDIVNNIDTLTSALFDFTSLEKTQQVIDFTKNCQMRNDEDPYSVFKDKSVVNKWKSTLDINIQKQIIADCKADGLKRFLVS